MSRFLTTISIREVLAQVMPHLPDDSHVDNMTITPMGEIAVYWHNDWVKSKYTVEQSFPVETLQSGRLPDGMTYVRPNWPKKGIDKKPKRPDKPVSA